MTTADLAAVLPGGEPAGKADVGLSAIAALFGRAKDVQQACRQIFGIPDYDRYLEHAAVTHPGQPLMSKREFFEQAIDRRYGGSRAGCC